MLSHSENPLYKFIEQEIEEAKASLAQNLNPENDAGALERLQDQLGGLLNAIKVDGMVQNDGVDAELRAAYVTFQGIIERAQAKALEAGAIDSAEGFIVTPRMCTPLMLAEGQNLTEIDLSNPLAFALYRKPILDQFLKAGGILNVIYSHTAKTTLADKDATGLANYASNLEGNSNLVDRPVIMVDMDKFPSHLTGAMYYAGGMPITIESRQVTQIDNITSQTWAIKIGESARLRVEELNEFFGENGADDLVRPVEWGHGV